jgi:hypothetical protein
MKLGRLREAPNLEPRLSGQQWFAATGWELQEVPGHGHVEVL